MLQRVVRALVILLAVADISIGICHLVHAPETITGVVYSAAGAIALPLGLIRDH